MAVSRAFAEVDENTLHVRAAEAPAKAASVPSSAPERELLDAARSEIVHLEE